MSIKLMVEVWHLSSINSTEKLLLLALADWANDEGLCWPSIDTLATKTSLSRRSVQGTIRKLEKGGLLRREQISGKGVKYWLTVKDTGRGANPAPVQNMRGRGANPAPNTTKILQRDIYKINLPDWLPFEAWIGFVNMRNTIKKPMTQRAVTRILAKLEQMREAGQDIEAVLDQSTNSCWSDVYEIKERRNAKQRKQVSGTATAAQRAIEIIEARGR